MESKRYGIGEWYGNLFSALNPEQKIKYANIKGVKKEICPHRNDMDFCNKGTDT